MTYGQSDVQFDCSLEVAHSVSSAAAQDVTHFHQFSANWLQTGSERSGALDWDDTHRLHIHRAVNECGLKHAIYSLQNRSVAPRTWLLSTDRHMWAINRRQHSDASYHLQSYSFCFYSFWLFITYFWTNKWISTGLDELNVFSPHLLLLWCGYTYLLFLLIFEKRSSLHFSTLEECVFTVSLQWLHYIFTVFLFTPWEIVLLFVSRNYAQRSTGVWACALFRCVFPRGFDWAFHL